MGAWLPTWAWARLLTRMKTGVPWDIQRFSLSRGVPGSQKVAVKCSSP